MAQQRKAGLTIGDNVKIQEGVVFSDPYLITIGNNVTIAPFVYFMAHDASTKRALNVTRIGRIVVGDDVFLGARSTIAPGVTIGSGAIVAACSVVTKDVEPDSLVKGNPARPADISVSEWLEAKRAVIAESELLSGHETPEKIGWVR
jgi:maltose O-acetyltransferase